MPHAISQLLINVKLRPKIVLRDMLCKYPTGISRAHEFKLRKTEPLRTQKKGSVSQAEPLVQASSKGPQ